MKKSLLATIVVACIALTACKDNKAPESKKTNSKFVLNKKIDCAAKQSCINTYNKIYKEDFNDSLVKAAYDSTVVYDKTMFAEWLTKDADGDILKIVFGVYDDKYEDAIRKSGEADAEESANYIHAHLGKLTTFAVTYKKGDLKTPISCYNLGTLEP